jgi:hypothetical protein
VNSHRLTCHDIMDALSIPLLSHFFLPSGYSTSLNLVFFYLTWSTIVFSHSPLHVELFGTLAVRTLFFVLPSTLFFLFDSILPGVSVSLKTQGDAALPIRKAGGRVKGKKARAERDQWWMVIGWSIANLLLGVGMQIGLEWIWTRVSGMRSALKVTTFVPLPWTIAKDVFIGLCMREVHSISNLDFLAFFSDTVKKDLTILLAPFRPPLSPQNLSLQSPPIHEPQRQSPVLFHSSLRPPPLMALMALGPHLRHSHPFPFPLAHIPPLPRARLIRRSSRLLRILGCTLHLVRQHHPQTRWTFELGRSREFFAVGSLGLAAWYEHRCGCRERCQRWVA